MEYIKIYEDLHVVMGDKKNPNWKKNIQHQQIPAKLHGKSCLDLLPKYFTESLPLQKLTDWFGRVSFSSM